MPADMGGKSPLREGSNEKSILAKIKQISPLLQFKTCAPALRERRFGNHPESCSGDLMDPIPGAWRYRATRPTCGRAPSQIGCMARQPAQGRCLWPVEDDRGSFRPEGAGVGAGGRVLAGGLAQRV